MPFFRNDRIDVVSITIIIIIVGTFNKSVLSHQQCTSQFPVIPLYQWRPSSMESSERFFLQADLMHMAKLNLFGDLNLRGSAVSKFFS